MTRSIQPAFAVFSLHHLRFFAAGDVVADDIAVSVVGSREASARGIEIARELARELVARKVTVVSGLAPGIDTAAHRAALDAGGRTVAVIGTGINRTYPTENRDLRAEIAARGLLLSQFWSNAPAQRQSFLMRNTAMSGYGLATVVVEAGEYSRARSQARMAVEHGRRVILPAQVVAQNQWARSLLGRPGVYLTRSLRYTLDLADQPSVLDVVDYVVECERERLVANAERDYDSGHMFPAPFVSQS